MKKMIFLAAIPLFLGALCAPSALRPVLADDVDLTPNFDEDFESYTAAGDADQLGAKWTNAYFEHTGDFNETACNPSHFSVQKDPANEQNKCLFVDTETSNESFFFFTMKGLTVKNFTLTYDYYPLYSSGSPWAGINCRKPIDGRYNGVTNVMLNHRLYSANAIAPDFYRSVDDSFTTLTTTNFDGTGPATTYTSDAPGFTGVDRTWLHMKFEVNEDSFALTINDLPCAKISVNKMSALHPGFVSLVSCVNKGYFDNIHLENLDTEVVPTSSDSSSSTVSAPVVNPAQYNINTGEDAVITLNTFGEKITTLKMGATEVLSKYYTLSGTTLTISKDYLATLNVGTFNFTVTTAGGTVAFKLIIASASTSSVDSSTSTPTTSSSSETPTMGGCGGEIAGSLAVSALALAGVGLLFLRKKRAE